MVEGTACTSVKSVAHSGSHNGWVATQETYKKEAGESDQPARKACRPSWVLTVSRGQQKAAVRCKETLPFLLLFLRIALLSYN